MKVPVECRCIECPLVFCCANCRRQHERTAHLLKYECPICRYEKFLCTPDNLNNADLVGHLVKEHLPLHCNKCEKIFADVNDFAVIGKCGCGEKYNNTLEQTEKNLELNNNQVTAKNNEGNEAANSNDNENEITANIINQEIEDRFNSLYEKMFANGLEETGTNFEAIVSINKANGTATITPVLQKKHLETTSSEEADAENPLVNIGIHTPHPKKSAKSRIKRKGTPHTKKLTRQIAQENWAEMSSVEETDENEQLAVSSVEDTVHDEEAVVKSEPSVEAEATPDREICGVQPLQHSDLSKTPSRLQEPEIHVQQLRTPVSHTLKVDMCAALASAVTTSTPTHPATGQFGMFPDPNNDSPLSEIEGGGDTASPGQGSIDELSKADTDVGSKAVKQLKSIIRSKLEGQDSSEKQVTFADSAVSDVSSVRTKKVKFSEDTKFEEAKARRVLRRPKRMLTPGPQSKMRRVNPHFQAILNRFENQQTHRTPTVSRDDQVQESTPALTDLVTKPVRAIDFKDESPLLEKGELVNPGTPGNEMFKSCIDSPDVHQPIKAIQAFTNNIAGSIHTCIASALTTNDDETEIQFKFVITKKRVSVRRIADDGNVVEEKTDEFERQQGKSGETLWKTIAKAVKDVFWSREDGKENYASNTPMPFSNVKGSIEMHGATYGSAFKRTSSELSDPEETSPVNHKRYKYGRIRGRRPLREALDANGHKMSHSADHQNLAYGCTFKEHEAMNQSF